MIPSAPVWCNAQIAPHPRVPNSTVRGDVAVIGGGFTGLSAAYHLLTQRPGIKVAVLEAQRIGAGASGRNTGMLGPGVGQSLTSLVRRHGPARAKALYAATLRAVEDVRRLVARERIDCELMMTGHLMAALNPAGRMRLKAQSALMAALDLPFATMDDEALDRAIRLERSHGGDGVAGLRLPIAGTLNPMRLLGGLADRVIARGGSIFESSRVITVNGRRPVRLAIDGGGEVVADEVVVATAGYTPALGLLRGRILPVHLQVVVTEPLGRSTRELLGWTGREGVIDSRRIFSYFRLTTDDRVVFGGGQPRYVWGGRTGESSSAPAALDRLARELRTVFPPQAALTVAGGWTGVIGYVLDALPAIERARGNPSLLHAVGWCGHGIALSVAAGEWITQILLDGAVKEDLPWYRDNPPLLPFETLRWAGFQAGVRALAFLDSIN
jgi:gamma-glutamylputrescine oxidase